MEQTIKVVVVGLGGMSSAWLQAAATIPGVEIVGLVDIFEENARKRAIEYHLSSAVISADLHHVLDTTHPDVVFDCTLPESHAAVTTEALKRGCHVLGEKPLADTLANALRSVAAAKKAGKIYAVIQNRRYDPNIRRLRQFIDSGEIGDLTTLNSDFYIGAHFGGFRDQMQHVLLLDMAIHTFDAARLISGADPVSVYCQEFNPKGSWYDHDASAVAFFTMSNGLVYTYRGSWCAEGLNTTWESSWRAIATGGSVTWDGGDQFQAQVVKRTGSFFSECEEIDLPLYDNPAKTGGHAGLIQEFIHCVRTGETPETVCTDNIKSIAMVFAAIKSAETGVRVEIGV